MATTETRYWDRVGLYVDRKMAEEFIERMVGHGTTLDEDMEEFVTQSVPDAKYLQNEIETLFSSPFEEKDISTDNQAILDLMTFEGNRKQFIKDKKAEGMTLEEAKELYKDALDEKVKAALPESFDEEE
jgi:hypothetical protein|tara:strand:+ start:4812 stop:5198 length:387 start_codon:yes stop_codon:yes gene_type:complete